MKTKWIFKFQKMLKFKKIQDVFDEVQDEAKTVEPNIVLLMTQIFSNKKTCQKTHTGSY